MIKSFLMIGQSNMAGRGNVNEVPPIYNERIKMLRNGQWQMMTEPINYDRPVAGIGLAASFASAWCYDNTEDTIGLIPCAEGGSVIDEWQIDGTLFKHAVSEAKFAMNNSELAGILWHQGESDSCNGNYKDYYQKLLVIVEALRLELKAPNIPFIIGGLGDFLGKVGFGKSCTEYVFINQELQRFTDEQDNCYYVTAANLTANPDGIHIDAKSQRKFGIRYYEAFYNKRQILEVLPNEEQLVIDKCYKEYTKSEMMYIHILDLSLGKITYTEFESRLKEMNN